MARSAASQPMGSNSEPSVGDLVAQAIRDVTQLFKFEIDLAKTELRADVRRVGLAVVLTGMAAFAGCLVMVLLSFALVYGLIRLGIVPWAAFLIVSAFLILLAALAILIVYVRVRGISGLRKTRQSVQEDLALLRRDDEAATPPAVEAG
jgi:uncharacterized membrane protein YqjE